MLVKMRFDAGQSTAYCRWHPLLVLAALIFITALPVSGFCHPDLELQIEALDSRIQAGEVNAGSPWLWAALGLGGAGAALVGIAVAPRLAPLLPEKLGKPLRALPRLYSLWPFLIAILLSLIIHAANIIAGHVIIHSLEPSVTLAQSAVLMPLIGASAFFPFTVGGAGVREAAFAALYGTVGVPEASAYAASLGFWGTQLFSAAIGGVINLMVPLSGREDD